MKKTKPLHVSPISLFWPAADMAEWPLKAAVLVAQKSGTMVARDHFKVLSLKNLAKSTKHLKQSLSYHLSCICTL